MLTHLTTQQLNNLQQAFNDTVSNGYNDPQQAYYEELLCELLGYTPTNQQVDEIEEQLNNNK